MIEMARAVAVSGVLDDARTQLRFVERRLAQAVAAGPHRSAGDWRGPAASAYQLGLDGLAREVEASGELLRSASDLLGAAMFELGGHD